MTVTVSLLKLASTISVKIHADVAQMPFVKFHNTDLCVVAHQGTEVILCEVVRFLAVLVTVTRVVKVLFVNWIMAIPSVCVLGA